jgi:hypothetical protein
MESTIEIKKTKTDESDNSSHTHQSVNNISCNDQWTDLCPPLNVRYNPYFNISFDNSGVLHLIYMSAFNKLMVKSWDKVAEEWNVIGNSPGMHCASNSLNVIFDSQNNLYICYTNGGPLTVLSLNEQGDWTNLGDRKASMNSNSNIPTMAIDSHDHLYISYLNIDGMGDSTASFPINVIKYDGECWTSIEGTDLEEASMAYIAIDANDVPHIASYYSGNGRSFYQSLNSTENKWSKKVITYRVVNGLIFDDNTPIVSVSNFNNPTPFSIKLVNNNWDDMGDKTYTTGLCNLKQSSDVFYACYRDSDSENNTAYTLKLNGDIWEQLGEKFSSNGAPKLAVNNMHDVYRAYGSNENDEKWILKIQQYNKAS